VIDNIHHRYGVEDFYVSGEYDSALNFYCILFYGTLPVLNPSLGHHPANRSM